MTESLSSIIHQIDTGQPVMQVTERVVDYVLTERRDIAEKMLLPLVRDEIRRRRREAARNAENEAFQGHDDAGPQEGHAPDVPGSPLEALRAVARGSFWVPGEGVRVPWGEATIEQHQKRSIWMRARSATLAEDADRHDTAIAAITETPGAGCLNDVLASVKA